MNKLWWRWDGGKTGGVVFAVGGEIMTSDSMITMCGCVWGGGEGGRENGDGHGGLGEWRSWNQICLKIYGILNGRNIEIR